MRPQTTRATITALNIYPVKSCAGTPLQRARLLPTGFEHDREWLIVQPNGRFVTQREQPRLALIRPEIGATTLTLHAPDRNSLVLPLSHEGAATKVQCWKDECAAFDAGDEAAAWLEHFLGKPFRLVRFDPSHQRRSDPAWTGDIEAFAKFSDAFPWLLLSQASLDDLNARLASPLPMNRFRPNIVIDDVDAYAEDRMSELSIDNVALRPVKPCTRCVITTTDQQLGERVGDDPLRTLRTYRFDKQLMGVAFGQNVILRSGAGEWLSVGDQLAVSF